MCSRPHVVAAILHGYRATQAGPSAGLKEKQRRQRSVTLFIVATDNLTAALSIYEAKFAAVFLSPIYSGMWNRSFVRMENRKRNTSRTGDYHPCQLANMCLWGLCLNTVKWCRTSGQGNNYTLASSSLNALFWGDQLDVLAMDQSLPILVSLIWELTLFVLIIIWQFWHN